jgi:hypothetical protein
MSYLILDTDKQSTHSLRLLLSAISTVPVWDVVNAEAFAGFSKKHPVPAEILLLDLDGDPAKVKAFQEHLMLGRSPSSALMTLGSSSNPASLLKADCYLQKPAHIENLKPALIDAQARTQEYRSTLIFYGSRIRLSSRAKSVAPKNFGNKFSKFLLFPNSRKIAKSSPISEHFS